MSKMCKMKLKKPLNEEDVMFKLSMSLLIRIMDTYLFKRKSDDS